jgi:lysophospholipase L1-like esterase
MEGETMILEQDDVLLMIGDSITDCGRVRIAHADVEPSLGSGYVSMVAETIHHKYSALNVNVVNKGNGGNTTRDLKARWQTDVLDIAPDWLTIMIGINDVWRIFDCPDNPEYGVPIDEYEVNLEELIASAKPVVKKGIILATPYFIEPNRQDKMRAMMDDYGAVVKKLAEKHGTLVVDTQAPFDKVLEKEYPMYFCSDRVHPNPKGHYLMAAAFLAVIEKS